MSASRGGDRSSGPSRRKLLTRAGLQVFALGAVGYAFFRERHLFAGFSSEMMDVRWDWIGLAVLAELGSIPPLAEAQRIVLKAAGTTAPRWRMNLVTIA